MQTRSGRLNRRQALVLACEARLLRRWARRNEESRETPTPGHLREQAAALLDQLIEAHPHDPRARIEKGLLLVESGRFDDECAFLAQALAAFPGAPGLEFAFARAERERARHEKRQYDSSSSRSLLEPWWRLQMMNPRFEPLKRLGEGRTWLAQTDGDMVREGALRSFGGLHKWIHPHLHPILEALDRSGQRPDEVRNKYRLPSEASFEDWWSREVQAYLFGGVAPEAEVGSDDLGAIVTRLDLYARPIDVLEEDFANRFALQTV